jgi:hypothetical protein
MRAIVIYESMFGDNKQVAEAIAAGLAEAGAQAESVEVGAAPSQVTDVDLVVVGSPNHAWSMPRPSTRQSAQKEADGPLVSQGIGVREWLGQASLPAGVRTAAYDTRGSHPKPVVAMDHAAASIDKRLVKLGGIRLGKPEAFHVADMKGPLEPGELERAQAWGRELGEALRG